MQKNSLKRKISRFIKPLIRALLLLLSLVFLVILIYYLKTINITSQLSEFVGVKPTPTPQLPPVIRVKNTILDKNLTVIGSWNGESIPEIILDSDMLYSGAQLGGAEIQELIKLIITLDELDLAVRQASIYNESYSELLLQDGVVMVYSSNNDPSVVAYTLKEMYAIFLIEGKKPKKIDFRFLKPTIYY